MIHTAFSGNDTSATLSARVMAAFSGAPIGRSRVSFGYRLGMLGVLLGLAVLPLLYLGMIAGACWLLVWHVQNDIVWFQFADAWGYRSPKALIAAGIAYVGIALAGVIFILFLIRPLFVPPPKEPPPVTLDPITEPALFALIHRICDLIGASRPTEVQVDCRVNASAGFRRGVASFFGNDMVLTIGMPLVAGMSVQQLAAVLAHEFGHFSQGGGMRVDYLVRRINFWLSRLVHGRDPWDDKLDIMEEGGSARRFVALTAKGMIWLGRLLLGWITTAGSALSSVMSRQMEFDADAYAARVVGSHVCTETLLRLPVLARAQAMVAEEMFMLLQSGSLPDNVPSLVSRHEHGMTDAQREKLRRTALTRDPEWWHTHPTLSERRDVLADLAAPGVFSLDAPASLMFTDFSTLCKTVSAYWYEVELGLDLNHLDLVNTDGMEKRTGQTPETHEAAVQALFGCQPPPSRLMPLPEAVPDHATQVARVTAWKDDYEAACSREKQLRNTVLCQTVACHMVHIGFELATLEEMEVDLRSVEAAHASQAEGMRAYEALSQQMQVFEQAAWGRIAAALAWQYQQPASRQAWQERVAALVAAQRTLAGAVQQLHSGWVEAWLVDYSGHNAGLHRAGRDLQVIRRDYDNRVHAALLRVVAVLDTTLDPLTEPPQKLSQTLRLQAPPNSDDFYSLKSYTPLMKAVHEHAALITGELCILTREAERLKEQAALGHLSPASPSSTGWQPLMRPTA